MHRAVNFSSYKFIRLTLFRRPLSVFRFILIIGLPRTFRILPNITIALLLRFNAVPLCYMNSQIPQFLEDILFFFPEISPPVTLSEEVAVKFSAINKALPQKMVDEHFARWDDLDEYTELVPCFQIPVNGPFEAVVWWRASLLSHEYVLATIAHEGTLISKKVIAGTVSDGNRVVRSVASIDEDNCVYSAVGESNNANNNYMPQNTVAYRFEILPDGTIQSKQEEINQWEEKEKQT